MTPARTLVKNSLSAITAEHGLEAEEADEEGLWGQIRDWRGDDVSDFLPLLCHVSTLLHAGADLLYSTLPSLPFPRLRLCRLEVK